MSNNEIRNGNIQILQRMYLWITIKFMLLDACTRNNVLELAQMTPFAKRYRKQLMKLLQGFHKLDSQIDNLDIIDDVNMKLDDNDMRLTNKVIYISDDGVRHESHSILTDDDTEKGEVL